MDASRVPISEADVGDSEGMLQKDGSAGCFCILLKVPKSGCQDILQMAEYDKKALGQESSWAISHRVL